MVLTKTELLGIFQDRKESYRKLVDSHAKLETYKSMDSFIMKLKILSDEIDDAEKELDRRFPDRNECPF